MWDSGVILIYIYYKCYITVFDKVVYPFLVGVFLFILGVFLNLFTSKSTMFLCFIFYYFLNTLKYNFNKFLELKMK